MSYSNIQSRVYIDVSALTDPVAAAAMKIKIEDLLKQIYDGSDKAAGKVDTWLTGHPDQQLTVIYTPGAAGTVPGAGGSGIIRFDPYTDFGVYISSNGNVEKSLPEGVLAHELGHAVTGLKDDDSFANLDGSNDDLTNPWDAQLGIPERATYEATDDGTTLRLHDAYTGGQSIDNAIFDIGPDPYDNSDHGGAIFDSANIDLAGSGVTGSSLLIGGSAANGYGGTASRDWIYGEAGNDALDGGDGDDFIYGGADSDLIFGGKGADEIWGGDNPALASSGADGIDTIDGGDGDDKIYGCGGDDVIVGGKGSDEIWGGAKGVDGGASDGTDTADYHASTSSIAITYDGAGTTAAISVKDGLGGVDTLHSIERILGTVKRDLVEVKGQILAGALEIDANGGQGSAPFDTINLKKAQGVHVVIGTGGSGFISNIGQDGPNDPRIALSNFHTGIIGSDYDDVIDDESSGGKIIDAGEGNNTVTVGGSGARVMARWGDDTITGSDGNDVIVSGGGTDTVDGGAGDDFISENDGAAFGTNQVLNGGSGNDWIDVKRSSQAVVTGGTGDDTIDVGGTWGVTVHFSTGDGHDSIVGRAGTGTETPENVPDNPVVTVDLGALSAADCTLVWDYGTQMISPPSGMPVDIPGIYQLAGEATLRINSTGESIYLGVLYGEAAGIPDNYPELDGDPILTPGSQTFNGYDFNFADGTVDGTDPADAGLVVQHGDAGSYNIAPGEFHTSQASDTGNTTGTSGDDTLAGGNAGGTINAGAGNDTIYAAHGAYTIDGGDGADTYDVFGGWNDYSFTLDNGELVVSSGTGFEGEARLTGIESIFFDTELTSVSVADIIATLSGPGNDTVIGTQFNDGLTGQAGDDVIMGRAGNDFINGGTGNDTLIGGGGDDYYDYVPGDGDDIIDDYGDGSGGSGGNDTLELEDVLSTDVTVSLGDSGRDLVLTLAGGGSVTLQGAVQDSNKQIEQVYFADGMMWSADDLLARVATLHGSVGDDTVTGTSSNDILYGAAGDDTLQGLEGNDVLNGGTGNDTLYGGDGDDVYRFAAGDGQDVIADFTWGSAGTGGVDTLQFGAEILPADVTVSQANDGADLVLTFAGTSDSITMSSAITASQFRIEHITFVDGTSWSYSDLMAKATTPTAGNDTFYGDETNQSLNGGAGNDSLYGRQGDDILTGGTGNDYLNGGPGSDTYIFAQGDGSDTIDDSRNASWINAIQLGAGMTQQNTFITTSANGLDVVVGFVDSSDTIAIRYMNISTGNGIDQIRFADGSSWSYADIMARRTAYTAGDDTITGTSGNETLYGGDGNDTLIGLAGNDSLVGGAGNDMLTGGAGDDMLNGGSGNDAAVFAGVKSDYQLTTSGGAISIADLAPTVSGDDGTDQLIGVETAQFSDQTVSLAVPVVLDLDGNGVALAGKASGTRFDWNGDGIADQTGWTSGGDGFLALDRNHDGRIESAAELSFANDKPGARSDLDGLSAFDSNGDGKLSAADSTFGDFRVWQDANANGVSDEGELTSLADAGIAAINLGGSPVNQTWAWDANVTINTGTFERSDGSVGQLADAALNYEPSVLQPVVGVDPNLEQAANWPRPIELAKLFDPPRRRMPVSALHGLAPTNDHLDHFRAASSFSEQLAAFLPESAPDWAGRNLDEKVDDTWFASYRRPDGSLLAQPGGSIF